MKPEEKSFSLQESVEAALISTGWGMCDEGVGASLEYRGLQCIAMLDGVQSDQEGNIFAQFGISTIFDHPMTDSENLAFEEFCMRESVIHVDAEPDGDEDTSVRLVFDIPLIPGCNASEVFLVYAWVPFVEFITMYLDYDKISPHERILRTRLDRVSTLMQ